MIQVFLFVFVLAPAVAEPRTGLAFAMLMAFIFAALWAAEKMGLRA